MKTRILLLIGLCILFQSGKAQIPYWDISYGKNLIGPESAPVALAMYDAALHIGGHFRRLNSNTQDILQTGYIAFMKQGKWDGLNGGMNAPITALTNGPNNTLYAAGPFTRCIDAQLQGIASWNGNRWSAINGLSAGSINALISQDNILYAAGIFDTIGHVPASSIAALIKGEWHPLGNGFKKSRADAISNLLPEIKALAKHNGYIFAGGDFDTAGIIPAQNIAYWDGIRWNSMGQGIQGEVDAITVLNNGHVIVASTITNGNTILPAPLMSWNGNEWKELGLPPGCISINALETDGKQIFVGGDFIMDSTRNDYSLSILDESGFRSLGGGVKGIITKLLFDKGTLYCAGNFLKVSDSMACRNIAAYVFYKKEEESKSTSTSISIYPNPSQQDIVSISFKLESAGQVELCLTMTNGRVLECFAQGIYEKGMHEITKVLHEGIPSGHYQCMLKHNGHIISVPMNIIH